MLRKTTAILLVTMFAAIFSANHLQAQLYTPFIDFGELEPDYQFFAHHDVEWSSFDHGAKPPPTGFFTTYDRMYLWVSRPENASRIDQTLGVLNTNFLNRTEPGFTRFDRTAGQRVDVGYMTDERHGRFKGHGWLFSWAFVGGPNINALHVIERLNRVNADDDVIGRPELPDPTMMMGGGMMMQMDTTDDLDFPLSDRNNHFFDLIFPATEPLGRDYVLQDSINIGTLTTMELNKTFRLERFHHGGYIEPFLGIRYINFKDFTIKDTYIAPFDVDPGEFPFGTVNDPQVGVAETLFTHLTGIQNMMFGGQLGLRYFNHRKSWKISSDVRFLALENFQDATFRRIEQTTLYAMIDEDEDPILFRTNKTETPISKDEFVYGIDVRLEAAYELTRDFSVRFGGQYMHLSRGIWRGNNVNFTRQDLILAGFTVGIELNR